MRGGGKVGSWVDYRMVVIAFGVRLRDQTFFSAFSAPLRLKNREAALCGPLLAPRAGLEPATP